MVRAVKLLNMKKFVMSRSRRRVEVIAYVEMNNISEALSSMRF